MNKEAIINEIRRELAFCRKAWGEIPGNPGQFVDQEKTRQFAAMQTALDVFEAMHGAEFHLISNRIERKKQEAEKQTSLF